MQTPPTTPTPVNRRNALRLLLSAIGSAAMPIPAVARPPRRILLQHSPVAGFQYLDT